MNGNVHHFLTASAARLPQKVALVCGKQRLTYGELARRSADLAEELSNAGVQRGERILLCLGNSCEAVIAIFATLRAGCTFVVVNPGTPQRKLVHIAKECNASVAFLDSPSVGKGFGTALHAAAPSLRLLVTCGKGVPDRTSAGLDFGFVTLRGNMSLSRSAESSIPACVIYTSGSTGVPKGVLCPHDSIAFVTDAICRYLESDESDIVMSVLPLSFTYGLYQVFPTFRVGATLVLERSFAFPAAVLKQMDDERVTGFAGVPTIFAMMLRMDLAAYDFSTLRYLTNAAAALSPEQITKIRRRFPNARFFSMYGQTETARSLYLPPEHLAKKPGSVGIPIPGTRAWVENESGELSAPGEVGELVVAGRHVMQGYLGDDAGTSARFGAGPLPGERSFRTGDLFKTDGDGCFHFVARRDDIIKTRGEKVAPKEVEDALCSLAGVAAAAVVGVPDPLLGQAIKAIVVADAPLTIDTVLAHCRANLDEFMVPRTVEFRDSLPTTESGKVKKSEFV